MAIILDTKGNITFCNDFLLNLTGWTRDEVLGRNWFDMFLPDEARSTGPDGKAGGGCGVGSDGLALLDARGRVLPFDPSFRDRRISEAADLIRASISAGLVVALVQGAIGGLAFALLGLGAPIFWGVMMAFFALLPLGGFRNQAMVLSSGRLLFGRTAVGLPKDFSRSVSFMSGDSAWRLSSCRVRFSVAEKLNFWIDCSLSRSH